MARKSFLKRRKVERGERWRQREGGRLGAEVSIDSDSAS